MKGKNRRLAAALWYARRHRWFVLPVHSVREGRCTCDVVNCSRPGKHPCTPHGVHDASRDPETIRRWWTEWPEANIGIATGAKSDILVIDVDPRNGGVKTLKALEATHGSLRDTTTAKTGGGGRHFIFAYPGFQVRKNALGSGIDVLSEGQYIIVPPSTHISGGFYSWLVGRNPGQKPPQPLPAAYHSIHRYPHGRANYRRKRSKYCNRNACCGSKQLTDRPRRQNAPERIERGSHSSRTADREQGVQSPADRSRGRANCSKPDALSACR